MEGLRQYMAEKRLTQVMASKRFGVSQPTVSDWLSGRIKPTAERLIELSEETGWTIDELLKGKQ